MIVTVDPPPQVEQAYLAMANERGLPLSELVREVLMAGQPTAAFAELDPEQRVREFRAWGDSHAAENLPLLSDEDISRESIYRERGL